MAYNANVPQPGDLLSQSQIDLLSNFTEINTFVNVNHEAFNSVAPHAQGKHKQIEMPVQAADVATDLTQWSMYVKNNTLGVPAPAIWLRPPVSAQHPAPANPIDITTAGMANNGWCRLPCGILMAWGTVNVPGGSTAVPGIANLVLTSPTIAGFPGFNAVYSAQATGVRNGGMDKYIWVSNLAVGAITIANPNVNAIDTYVLVIGNR